MPASLHRSFGFGNLHFVTFSCCRRAPLLGTPGPRSLFVATLGEVREKYRFKLVGYVVMPEHVHLLISEPDRGNVSLVLQLLKQTVSRRLSEHRIAHPEQSPMARTKPPCFWERRFYDFSVWSRAKAVEKLAYIHTNPLRRGLVSDVRDWPWSSYVFYFGEEDPLLALDPIN